MKGSKKFYLGQRVNPQLSKPYFNAYGKLTIAEMKQRSKCSYGSIYMESFETEAEYLSKIESLRNEGYNINIY